MRKMTNFLRGSVRIRLNGAFPERFLNLCGTENFPFWDIERETPHTIFVTIPVLRLKRAREMAERLSIFDFLS